MCSPRLYETRSNLFYLNIKTVHQKKKDLESPNFKDASLLEKVQITIRKYKRNGLQYENVERGLMLSRMSFFKSIVSCLLEITSFDSKIKIIDIINWLFYNQMGNTNSEFLCEMFLFFEQNLNQFIDVCYINGNRSTSRKATLLLSYLLSPVFISKKNISILLLNCLLKNLDYLQNFTSSCSMNWYFVILNQCMHFDIDLTYAKCLNLLNKLVLAHKYDSYNTLLKMRCNLSGLIFEPKLFSLDSCLKFDNNFQAKPLSNQVSNQLNSQGLQSTSNPFSFSFGSVGLGTNHNQLSAANVSVNNVQNLCNSSDENPSLISQVSGLIEVLPLNFKSVSLSSGSSIEKNGVKQQNSLYILPDYYSITKSITQTQSNPGLDTTILSSLFTMNQVQHMIIDRMEPMSKHFVILDFGYPICLSDIQIPSCSEISSISVDIWLNKEQKDSKRICLSTDISSQPIILNDLQPPPICRYIKLIFVAHSSNIVKARIPLGYYFGHPYIFTSETSEIVGLPIRTNNQIMAYLSYLEKLYEDSKCHYSISVNKLKEMLDEILYPNDNVGHLKMMQFSESHNTEQMQKIKDQYYECLEYQFKLNLNYQLIRKLKNNMNLRYDRLKNQNVEDMSEDQLRISNLILIKTILSLSNEKLVPKLKKYDALNIFNNLCVNACLDRECSWLLIKLCQNEEWWGDFIRDLLELYFVKQLKQPVHLSRIFATLNGMCIKSLSAKQSQNLFNSLFGLVEEILQDLDDQKPVEVTCLEWIFLFISRLFSVTIKSKEINRWDFLENAHTTTKSKTNPAIRHKTKIKKKFFQSNKYLTWNKIKETRKNLEKYKKNLWKSDINNPNTNSNNDGKLFRKFSISRNLSLRVCKLIVKLLVSANSYTSSDLFVLSCRIISYLCCNSLPSINLNEIFQKEDLTQLIFLNVSSEFNHGSVCWGSPWSQHALISLLLDIIENEKPEQMVREKKKEQNTVKSLRMIEELDEAGSDRKIYPTNISDAVKLTSNLAENFSQIANILTNHLSIEEKSADKDILLTNEQSLINNLVESAMNKKLDEIKNNIVTPIHQINSIFGSSSSSFSKKPSQYSKAFKINQELKISIDNRLESSYYKTLESFLNIRIKLLNDQLNNCITEFQCNTNVNDVELFEYKIQPTSSIKLIQDTLQSLFEDLSIINIENLLSFWLNLSASNTASTENQEANKETPNLNLDEQTCLKLLKYLNQYSYMNVKIWHLSFRIFIAILDYEPSMALFFSQNDMIYKLIYKFLSKNENLIGDECCVSMIDFLKKIEKSLESDSEKHFKLKLFQLLNLSLDANFGCISNSQGSVDAQVSFIEYLITLDYYKCYDLNNEQEFETLFTKYFTLLAFLTQNHINSYQKLSLKGLINPRSCFSSVLSSLLFGQKEKFKFTEMSQKNQLSSKKEWTKRSSQSVQCCRDLLICLLLKFAIGFFIDINISFDDTNEEIIDREIISENQEVEDSENFYDEDDLLLQQLFLYELQIDENDLTSETIIENEIISPSKIEIGDFPRTNKIYSSKSNLTKILSENNLKQKKLIRLVANESLEVFIESLALCQSSALAMVISNSGYPIEIGLDDIQTPGDGLFLLLKSIVGSVPLKLVEPASNYLQKIKRLSEPLLWLFSFMFQNESVIKTFIENNGIEIISKGLSITTNKLLYSGPCIVSSLMNLIDSERQYLKNNETESTEGFTNFAQYGSIVCTNPSGNPVDILIQNSNPHRRIRSSIWSYHFQHNENKVGLYISFTYAFLLKEVHIIPHTVSFGNCPAYVSVEVSRDGSFMTPIGPPVYTMGMSCIKLQLNKSELVNSVQLNLYKSKDSQMIGLSQIKLLGYPMFENMHSAKPDMMLTPVEDLVSRSNMGWLRLLYMCIESAPQVESLVCEKIQDSTMVLCTKLLCSPAMIIYDRITETILLKLSKYNNSRSLEITKWLLRAESGSHSGLYNLPHGFLMETLVNILYQISENLDSELELKYSEIIFNWLEDIFKCEYMRPSSMVFHCVACIIYKTNHLPEIKTSLIQDLISYSTTIRESNIKQSIDWLLCALLYKDPNKLSCFIRILKENSECESLIDTLSYGIQSDRVLDLFLNSEFFNKFIRDFESDLKFKQISLSKIKVLIGMADFEKGKKWFGSNQACCLWQGVVKLMCITSLNFSEQIRHFCIKLIKKIVFLNENNQVLFSNFITEMIKDACNLSSDKYQTHNPCPTISGFLHQLILQVLLEDQTILVNLNHKNKFKTLCNSSTGNLYHPKFSTGSHCTVIELSLSRICLSISSKLSDLPSNMFKSAGTQECCGSSNEKFLEVRDFLHKIKNEKRENKVETHEVTIHFNICINKSNYIIPNDLSFEKIIDFYSHMSGVNHVNSLDIQVNFDEFPDSSHVSLVKSKFTSPLETFVKYNGLTILAEKLPILMPFIHEPFLNITDNDRATSQTEQPKTSPDFVDYVIMNESDGPFADEMYNEMPGTATNSMSNQSNKLKKMTMPPHAFIAFGLFLKIPGYASIMMKNKKQAQSILKLLLGANRNKEDEFGLSLSTMPFSSLKDLLNESKLKENRFDLTSFIHKSQILTFILSILSNISHHPHRQKEPYFVQNLVSDCMVNSSETSGMTSDEKSNLYWAKGTGFGTGSTIQQWDAEKTLMQQKMDEEHIACILEVLQKFFSFI